MIAVDLHHPTLIIRTLNDSLDLICDYGTSFIEDRNYHCVHPFPTGLLMSIKSTSSTTLDSNGSKVNDDEKLKDSIIMISDI